MCCSPLAAPRTGASHFFFFFFLRTGFGAPTGVEAVKHKTQFPNGKRSLSVANGIWRYTAYNAGVPFAQAQSFPPFATSSPGRRWLYGGLFGHGIHPRCCWAVLPIMLKEVAQGIWGTPYHRDPGICALFSAGLVLFILVGGARAALPSHPGL